MKQHDFFELHDHPRLELRLGIHQSKVIVDIQFKDYFDDYTILEEDENHILVSRDKYYSVKEQLLNELNNGTDL